MAFRSCNKSPCRRLSRRCPYTILQVFHCCIELLWRRREAGRKSRLAHQQGASFPRRCLLCSCAQHVRCFIDSMLTNTIDIHCHRKSGIPPYLVSAVLGCWVNDTVLQRLDDGRYRVCREAEPSRKQAKETASFLEHGGLT